MNFKSILLQLLCQLPNKPPMYHHAYITVYVLSNLCALFHDHHMQLSNGLLYIQIVDQAVQQLV